MKQRYDLAAFALLASMCTLLIAIVISPKKFTVSDWQPLMAAMLTLGGAGIVYRGARLAYKAAMAKVDLDRENSDRELRRIAQRIYLRASFNLLVIEHEASQFNKWISPAKNGVRATVEISQFVFSRANEFEEAWDNLEAFPRDLQRLFSEMRIHFYDFGNAKAACPGTEIVTFPVGAPDAATSRLKRIFRDMQTTAEKAQQAIHQLIE